MHYLPRSDDVIYSGFGVISKIIFANFCKPIHDIINYSTFICHFESRKCGNEVKILQKFEYLKNDKSFLDETENIIHSF